MAALIILQRMLVLLAMMMAGYFCYKKGWIDDHSYAGISKLVVNIANPLLIINGVLNKNIEDSLSEIVSNLILMCVYFIVLIVLSIIISNLLKVKDTDKYLYQMMLVFSNVGFMGIPVITSLYGDDSMIYIAFYILGYNFLLYTYGVFLANKASIDSSRKKESFSFKKIINVGVIACIIAILIFVLGIDVPDAVETFVSSVGNIAVPLSMMLIGASFAKQDIKGMFKNTKMFVFLFLKLLLIPILATILIKNVNMDINVVGVFCLMLAMPVGSIVVLFAKEHDADEELCTMGSVISTVLSVITIPIVALFL